MKESNKNLPNYGIKLFYLECNNNKKNNMIVLHGLLGNSNDFISLCQHKNISVYANSYIVDLRNHGKSPHT
jgi:pimeloyl-ACP methyl ester carboxylesterase